jgi:hypothetical protein
MFGQTSLDTLAAIAFVNVVLIKMTASFHVHSPRISGPDPADGRRWAAPEPADQANTVP